MIKNTIRQAIAGIGVKIKTTPNEVATALPPLNSKNMEKECPMIAAAP